MDGIQEEMISKIAGLARRGQVVDAKNALDVVIQDRPEWAAQLYVLARLFLEGGEGKKQALQTALAKLGEDSLTAYRDTLAILDQSESQPSEPMDQLDLLETFLTKIQLRQSRSRGLDASARVAGLELFLIQLQGARIRWLLGRKQRIQERLLTLQAKLDKKRIPIQPVAHRLVSRLESLRDRLSTTKEI